MRAGRIMTGKRRKRSLTRPGEADRIQMPSLEAVGGRLNIVSDTDMARIHEASLALLGGFGMSDAPRSVTDLVCGAGGTVTDEGRLAFPRNLVERALDGLQREVTLFGREPGHNLRLDRRRVGRCGPHDSGRRKQQLSGVTLGDLYDAARLVDAFRTAGTQLRFRPGRNRASEVAQGCLPSSVWRGLRLSSGF